MFLVCDAGPDPVDFPCISDFVGAPNCADTVDGQFCTSFDCGCGFVSQGQFKCQVGK